MSKISPDGSVSTDIFTDFSIFNFKNIYIGPYAAKINKGTNNLMIGNNAGKIGIGLNNSIFIGANAGTKLLNTNNVINIGDIQVSNNKIDTESINIGYNIRNNSNGIVITNDKQQPQMFLNNNGKLDIGIFNQGITETTIGNYNSNINTGVNIGNSNISTVKNSTVIGNSIFNDKFSLNIDNVLCKDDKGIYLGCGIYKNLPIIFGSSSNDFSSDNLSMGSNFITSVFKIKNDSNVSISFITNTNENIIYNLPSIPPNNEYTFLSTDKNGNLEWVELNKIVVSAINTSGHIICNYLDSANLIGDGSLITSIDISDNTTDNLNEGLNNLYLTINTVTKYFYSYIKSFTSDDIKIGNSSNYFTADKYKINFYSNLSNLITTDDITGERFYSSNDYYSNSSNYILNLNTDFIKEGVSNLYYKTSSLSTDFIDEGTSNRYYKEISINISNTDSIKRGSSNIYFNNSNIIFNLTNIVTTDSLKQGKSNLYSTDYNILNYFNSNVSLNTDLLIQGASNDYFSNINNQNKYQLNTDNIREGSNIYYKSPNQITGIIAFNTNTDLYNEGISNIYYYENRGINDFLKLFNSNVTTTDNYKSGNNKKFITNNFYNNNLQISGFLKANNINNLDKENLRSNLEPKIGPLTEVYHVYDFERLSVVGQLSNIEIGYTANNVNDTKVPFIVIDNKVGINNSNPKYQLDVDGSVNCSNFFINNSNFINITSTLITDSSNQLYNIINIKDYYTISQTSNIFVTSNILLNTSNQLFFNNSINYYTRLQTSNIFVTSNVLSNTSNQLFLNNLNNYYTRLQTSNIFVTSNVLSNTSNELFKLKINDYFSFTRVEFSNIFVTSNLLSNTSNVIVKNSLNLNSFANYNLYFNNSNIGINNKTPLYNLDINSEINIYSNIRNDDNIIISNSKVNVVIPPIVWFKFDDNFSWLVDTMGGNSLTYQYPGLFLNQVVFDNNLYNIGKGSVRFNPGNQTLVLNNGADIINNINNNNGITITFWIYGYNYNVTGYYLRFYLNTSSGNYNIIINGVNNFFNFNFETSQGTYTKSNVYIGALNTWNFFVLVIQKDGTWIVYSNGVLNTSFTPNFKFPSIFVTYSGNFMIIGNAYMNIDDFRIYSGILTNLQITSLYNKNNDVTFTRYTISSDIFVTSNVLSNNLNKTWVNNDGSNIYNNNTFNVGIGTAKPSFKLHVVGNVGVSGTVNQGFSDIRLKNNIEMIKKPFTIINNIQGFYYNPNEIAKSYGFNNNDREIGLNALEVKKVIPEVVSLAPFDMDENKQSKSGENYLTVSYEKLVPVLIEGLKELKKEVEYLKNELKYR